MDKQAIVYIIPTPIGNIDDITNRAIKTLEQVDIVYSEDTRETINLFKKFGIVKKLYSNHNFNERKNKEKFLNHLQLGKKIAIVSDRGTPIISDPGYELVKVAIENNVNVVSLPGATALIPALTLSGLNPSPFLFYGFLNSKKETRKKELKGLLTFPYTLIFYESPHRIKETLNDMLEILGDRQISISREISKLYEETIRGNILKVIENDNINKGELVIVVDGNKEEKSYTLETINEYISFLKSEEYSSKEIISKVSKELKISKNEVYKIYHGL